jgi:hypothetical protein
LQWLVSSIKKVLAAGIAFSFVNECLGVSTIMFHALLCFSSLNLIV